MRSPTTPTHLAALGAKTLGAQALLLAALPFTLALTGAALLRCAVVPRRRGVAAAPKTVMISGGKMTKALALARSFHRAGHRVVLVETRRYRLTGHRFSRAVDAFHTVPEPQDPGYVDALIAIVRAEGVDVYVPVCSPVSSRYDARARPELERWCDVVHGDADLVGTLDDKYAFAVLARSRGLPVPDTHRVTSPREVEEFDFPGPYILKSIPYDPSQRLDLTPLPRETAERTATLARSKPISETTPWILQAFVGGREYCVHTTVRDGRIQVYCCCASSAFQVNYATVDHPAIETWVTDFVRDPSFTGQFSFDFIETDDGHLYAIECNPRTHSAITMFYDHPRLARAYLESTGPVVRPTASSRPTHWTFHELWRLLSRPAQARRTLATLRRGKDAIFDWSDPLPFLMVHHLQIPWLLARNLAAGKGWIRIDFNIGKLVEPAGD